MLEAEFNSGTSVVKVDYWACSREEPQNDGFHYNCALKPLKLTGYKKLRSVKNRIAEKHDIQVNFSDKHNFCLSAYTYVCKYDQEVAHSENHPPKTKSQLQDFMLPVTQKGNTQLENLLVLLQRSEKG